MSDGHEERALIGEKSSKPLELGTHNGWPFARSFG